MTDIAVVVSTCDKYHILWEPFCHGLRKFWPDCPWAIQWITNHLDAPIGKAVKVGDDANWSDTSIAALRAINAEVVLWIHDDNWLTERVDNDILASLGRLLLDHDDLNAIRLSNCYMSTTCGGYKHDERLRMLCQDSQQRCSLQPSFWRREVLLNLLQSGESPWSFEGEAAHRSWDRPGDHTCCREGFYPLRNLSHVDPADWGDEAMRRGEWTTAAVKYAVRERININFSIHPNGNKNTKVPY